MPTLLPSARPIRRTVLPSGMVLIHEEKPSVSAVAYQVWVKAGSAHEEPDEIGAAHCLEHMLFKGTPTRDAIVINDEVENLGGAVNAYTTYDQTVFHMMLSSRFWKEGLSILLDLMFNSELDEEELEIERNVILEELREGEDSPDIYFGEAFFKAIYPRHGYGRQIIGDREHVEKMTRETIVSFYKKWYRPENLTLVVAGDVEWAPLNDAVQELTDQASKGKPYVRPQGDATMPEDFVYEIVNRGSRERIIELAFPIPPVRHEDIPAIDLLSYVLGDGDISRLYREIRIKRELARAVSALVFSPQDEGRFMIRALPNPEGMLPLVCELANQLRRIQRQKVSAVELQRAKLLLDKELIFNDETVEGRAKSVGYYEAVFGSYEEETRYRERIYGVTEEQLREVARKYLDFDRISVGMLLPKGEEAPSTEEMKSALASDREASKRYPTRFGRSENVDRFTLSNGIRVSFRRFYGSRLSSVYGAATGGLWGENVETNGISNLISATQLRGTASRSDERISEEMLLLQGEMGSVTGRNTFGVRLDVVRENFFRALDLYSELLWNPTFPTTAIDQERRVILRDLETQADYFETVAANLYLENLYPKHPYGMNILGRSEVLSRLQREDLLAYYPSVIRPDRLALGISGDHDPEEVREELEAALGSAKITGSPIEIENQLAPLKTMKEVRRPIDGEKAYLHYGFRGPTLSSPDRLGMEVLSSVLSSFGGGRLYQLLREELGLVYGVDTSIFLGIDTGNFSVLLNTSPDQVEQAYEEVRKEFNKLRTEPISAEELERVKNFLIGGSEMDLQRSSSRAAQLSLGELFGTDRTLEEYVAGISAVTIDDVKEIAERYLLLDRASLVLLSPAVN